MTFFEKIALKLKDPEAYKNKVFAEKLSLLSHPNLQVANKAEYHFKHSGNAGDLIYAIPAMLALAKGRSIHLHLHLNQKGHYGKAPHPLGGVMLNTTMLELLQPLLLAQLTIAVVDEYTNQPIDYNLDVVRQYPLLLNRGNIVRWYFLAFATNWPVHKPWLMVQPNMQYANAIIVARSQRYRAPGIDHSFLAKYPHVYFVGVDAEYADMVIMVPNIMQIKVNNFLELAQVIGGCKLFIGNQSFPFALAEAMKVNRLLEIYFQSPNVSVSGPNGYDFCFQPQFELLVEQQFRRVD